MLNWIFNDGGRYAEGYTTIRADCDVRAVAIALEIGYTSAADLLRASFHNRPRMRDILPAQGWEWIECTMQLDDQHTLPLGRLILLLKGHYTTLVDGVIHDTYNPVRNGLDIVCGYWKRKESR